MEIINQLYRNSPFIAITIISGFIVYHLIMLILKRIMPEIQRNILTRILDKIRWPLRLLILALILASLRPFMDLPEQINNTLQTILTITFIIIFAWLLMRIIAVVKMTMLKRYSIEQEDNLKARKVVTQLRVAQRILNVIIIVISIAAILMTFDKVRQFGVSILASAGISAIILGFAAQRSLATLFAGLQIAITQPIRIDDVVIVEGEWGWIEEITLTYVVVRIWDLRRLVVPITYFLDKPFQNWTRTSADILGTVFLYTDYRAPIQRIREKAIELVKANPYWDGKVAGLQVTNSTENTVELRVLMSAATSPKAWNLRCDIREALITFLQQEYPDILPRTRVELYKASTSEQEIENSESDE
ncbi:mechanosensitive ion channel [candidate division KSB1 bacterium]|jgi:small-conductance mechanosensitive channel|nr:mechanosensitive ion channel [candidate division KSB1 bacterium]